MITGARGIRSYKTFAELYVQLLDGDAFPFGRPSLETCAVEAEGANIPYYQGRGVRSSYWTGLSRLLRCFEQSLSSIAEVVLQYLTRQATFGAI